MLHQTVKSDSKFQRIVLFSLQSYPIIAYLGILLDQVVWVTCYLLIVIYLSSLKWLSQQHYFYKSIAAIFFVVLLYALIYFEQQTWIVFIPPVLIPAFLAFIFLSSLRSEYALISKIAERMEGTPLDAKHLLYTRHLTVLWGIAFIMMVFEAVLLAIWAPFELWSWWVHVGNYIIVASLFVGEMLLRPLFIGKRANVLQMFKEILQRNWNGQKNK